MKIKQTLYLILVLCLFLGHLSGCTPIDINYDPAKYAQNSLLERVKLEETHSHDVSAQVCDPNPIFESVAKGDSRWEPLFEAFYGIDGQTHSIFRGMMIVATFDRMVVLGKMFSNPHHYAKTSVQRIIENINYSEYFVIAVFRGSTSLLGQGIEVQQISWQDDNQFLIETLTSSGPGSAATGEPYHIIKIPKRCHWNQEVDFVLSIDGEIAMTRTHYIPPPRLLTELDTQSAGLQRDAQVPEIMLIATPDEISAGQGIFSEATLATLQAIDYKHNYVVAAIQSQQSSAGDMEIERLERRGDRMILHAQTAKSVEESLPYQLFQIDRRYEEGDTIDFILSVDDQAILTRTHHIPLTEEFKTIELSSYSAEETSVPPSTLFIAANPDEISDLKSYVSPLSQIALDKVDHHNTLTIGAFLGTEQNEKSVIQVYQVTRHDKQILINARSHSQIGIATKEGTLPHHVFTIDKPADWGGEMEFVLAVDGQRTLTQTHYVPIRYHFGMIKPRPDNTRWNFDQPYLMAVNAPPTDPFYHPLYDVDPSRDMDYNQHFLLAAWHSLDPKQNRALEIKRVSRDHNQLFVEAHTIISETIGNDERSSPYHFIWLNRMMPWDEDMELLLSLDDEAVLSRTIYTENYPFESVYQSISPLHRDTEPSIQIMTTPVEASDEDALWTPDIREDLQTIDYNEYFAIVIFRGYKYSTGIWINIEQLSLQGNRMIIDALAPVPSTAGRAWTSPFQLIKVKKDDLVGRELDFELLINGRQAATQVHYIADIE